MKILSLVFFYGYVGFLVVFGALGVFTARLDHPILFKLQPESLPPKISASVLSQYRFFRAIECGFGVFAFTCRKAIFQKRFYNRLFLGTLFGGVLARMVSLLLDGSPLPAFYAFLLSELIGGTILFIYTRTTLEPA